MCRLSLSNGEVRSPSVRAATRDQFGCNSARGAPLEDQGGPSTAGSHWEASLFQTEMMIGASAGTERAVLSNITLALAEDSGWYEPNYAAGGFLRFGWEGGCDMLVWLITSGTFW